MIINENNNIILEIVYPLLRKYSSTPAHLAKTVEKEVIEIETEIQAILKRKFKDWIDAKAIHGDTPKIPTLAFVGVVDTIMISLVYDNDEKRLQDKLEDCWAWPGDRRHIV